MDISQVAVSGNLVLNEVERAVVGKRHVLEDILAAFLAHGRACAAGGLPRAGKNPGGEQLCHCFRDELQTHPVYA